MKNLKLVALLIILLGLLSAYGLNTKSVKIESYSSFYEIYVVAESSGYVIGQEGESDYSSNIASEKWSVTTVNGKVYSRTCPPHSVDGYFCDAPPHITIMGNKEYSIIENIEFRISFDGKSLEINRTMFEEALAGTDTFDVLFMYNYPISVR